MDEASAVLRPWTVGDAEAVLTAFASPDMFEQAPDRILDIESARAWIAQRLTADPVRACCLAIEVEGSAVGEVALSSIDRRHRTAWASYWLTPSVRGRGLATRALATVVAHAIDELGLARVELGHRTNNPGSGAVARRAGFALEGTERARLEYDGVRYDVDRHAFLVGDPRPDLDLFTIRLPGARVA